jgi:hypothetical protein
VVLVHISISFSLKLAEPSHRRSIAAVYAATVLSAADPHLEALAVALATPRLLAATPGSRFFCSRVEKGTLPTDYAAPHFCHLHLIRLIITAAGTGASGTAKPTAGEADTVKLETTNFGASASLLPRVLFGGGEDLCFREFRVRVGVDIFRELLTLIKQLFKEVPGEALLPKLPLELVVGVQEK